MRLTTIILVLAFGPASLALGQSSSLFRAHERRLANQATATTRPAANGSLRAGAGTTASAPRNEALAKHSLTAVSPPEPTLIKPNDLIAVIVRHRYRSKSDAKMEQESEWDVSAKLDAFFRIHDRKLLQQAFRGGRPEVKFGSENELENEAKTDRRDILETRLMGKVLDVKPNGNLIIVASYSIGTDHDVQSLVLSGEINRRDLGPDRNISSDKIFDLKIRTYSHGAIVDGTKRGWFKKFLDKVKPF